MGLHPKLAPFLFGFLLSGLMSLIVAGISTARVVGLNNEFAHVWQINWLSSWVVAFPTVLVVAPVARKLVSMLVSNER